MRYDRHVLSVTGSSNGQQCLFHPIINSTHRFAAIGVEIPRFPQPAAALFRIQCGQIRPLLALPAAAVDLYQACILMNRQIMVAIHRLRGAHRPQQRAAVYRIQRYGAKAFRQPCKLLHPRLADVHIDMPLEKSLAIALGFTMAHQIDGSHKKFAPLTASIAEKGRIRKVVTPFRIPSDDRTNRSHNRR